VAGTIKSTVAVSLALVLTGAILFAVLHGGDGLIRKSSAASGAFTEVVVQVDEESLVARVAALSHGVLGRDYRLDLNGKFANFYLERLGETALLSTSQSRFDSDNNPALKRYSQLSVARRNDDFVLFPLGNLYWPSSEYSYRAKPAAFSCSFILHFEAVTNTATRVEIIEASPVVKAGKRFGWSAHTGPFPQFFDNIRFVAPTIEDRQELLRSLQAAFDSK
jgi:hypothetical protein